MPCLIEILAYIFTCVSITDLPKHFKGMGAIKNIITLFCFLKFLPANSSFANGFTSGHGNQALQSLLPDCFQTNDCKL